MTSQERQLYDKKLYAYSFTDNDLTEEEKLQLEQEVKDELKGKLVLDGVLHNKPRYTARNK